MKARKERARLAPYWTFVDSGYLPTEVYKFCRKTMPLVRIDVRKGKDVAYRQEIGRVVYEALVGVGAPKDDRFQVISECDTDNFLFDPDYIGIHRTNDLVTIQITCNEGRNPGQKKALYKAIADGLHSAVGLRREDVLINLVEVKKENWSFGNGIAQYAV
jgi:4-oxalocrotonate tautomerase